MVVRSLAAFLSVQVQSETELRLQPTSDLQLSAKAQQVCNKKKKMQIQCFHFLVCNYLLKITCVSVLFVDADIGDVGGHAQQ